MIQTNLEKIEETVRDFFERIGMDIEVEIKNPQDSTIPINLKMDEPQILIGERGQTLIETQHLLKIILKRKINTENPFYIDLDINGYKKKKIEYLKETARTAADEVALNKKEKQLPAMSAYERRIIHLELASRSDVTTESIGQEPERQVVIRPYP